MDITEILRKIGDIAVGTPETALSLASGAIAYPAAKFGGALTSAMTGGRGDLAQYAEDYITDKMTYKPTSQSGQEAMNIAGSALSIPYKPAEYVKEKYGYIPGYATEMAINLLMPRLAGRWSEMKAKGLGQTGLYGGDLSKTMQEAKGKGYPENKSGSKPIVAYHKTDATFDKFDESKIGQHDYGYAGRGFYFTPEPIEGLSYGKNTIKVEIDLKNPYIRTIDNWDKDSLNPYVWIPNKIATGMTREQASRAWTDMMKSKGYDGFIDRAVENGEIVVFDSGAISKTSLLSSKEKK